MAGLAAAFAFGNAPASAATADASGQQPAAAGATSQTDSSGARLLSLIQQPGTGHPLVRLDATQLAQVEPKGKHHRTPPAKYVVRSGDTLASIAQHLYHSSNYWTVLYWANHGAIKYANQIHAGQELTVPAKPAKVPAAPKSLAPTPAPATSTSTSTGTGTSTGSSGASSPSASTTQAAPVQTASTYTGSTGSFQACVIAAESGGNPQVMNSRVCSPT
jgi:LysM repeat protein